MGRVSTGHSSGGVGPVAGGGHEAGSEKLAVTVLVWCDGRVSVVNADAAQTHLMQPLDAALLVSTLKLIYSACSPSKMASVPAAAEDLSTLGTTSTIG